MAPQALVNTCLWSQSSISKEVFACSRNKWVGCRFIDKHRIIVKAEIDSASPSKYTFNPIQHDLDVQAYKLGIKNPFGLLSIISNELLINGASYFCVEKIGLLKRRIIPILFADEKLEKLSDVTWRGYSNASFYFTGRRFLIPFSNFMQSKWIKPKFTTLFSILKADHWQEGLFEKEKYDGISRNIQLSQEMGRKCVAIGSLKHLYADAWEPKTHSPSKYFLLRRNEKIEGFFLLLIQKAEEAIETDILDLIALEDFCLTSKLDIYKIGFNEQGSLKLERGRLNLGKKKIKISNPVY